MNTPQSDCIRKAAGLLGSQRALAGALDVTPVTVNQWLLPVGAKNARPIPPKQCVRIERLTAGQVKRQELRPDDWAEIWPELAVSASVSVALALTPSAQAAALACQPTTQGAPHV